MYIISKTIPCFHCNVGLFRNTIPAVSANIMKILVLTNEFIGNSIGLIIAPIPSTRFMFTITLPIMSPNARSPCPITKDFKFTTSSGTVVPTAMNTSPMKNKGIPALVDMFVTLNTNHLALSSNATKQPVNTNMSFHIFLNVMFCTSFTFSSRPPTQTVVM